MILMRRDDKASVSLKKVISISIILLFVMGIGVMAASSNLTRVKIILADGYEMDVLTSKTKISEILEENHIMVLPTQRVIPGLDENISDNNTIKVTFDNGGSIILAEADSEEFSAESIMNDYSSVTEKVVKEQVAIAYETETKDLSKGQGEKIEKVVQNGEEGQKEISYLVKYQDGEEVEKTQISENLVKEPVNCVKEIKNKPTPVVTSRSEATVNPGKGTATAEEASSDWSWSGKRLTRSVGVVPAWQTPHGYRETYYNLNMSGCISLMGLSLSGMGVRSDGVKTYNGYVMVASPDLRAHPKGSYIKTTVGMGIVVDYCPSGALDIAVTW